MNANEIKNILLKEYYPKGRKIIATNFAACGFHEADVIMVTDSMLVYEYEVKCSLQDYRADFKKLSKHKRLQGIDEASFNGTEYNDEYYLKFTGTAGRPNYFYYICEEDLIPLEEIPSYAGLIYITKEGLVKEIKKAPKIHKHKSTEKLILQICKALTARMIFGCSYMNYKNKIS